MSVLDNLSKKRPTFNTSEDFMESDAGQPRELSPERKQMFDMLIQNMTPQQRKMFDRARSQNKKASDKMVNAQNKRNMNQFKMKATLDYRNQKRANKAMLDQQKEMDKQQEARVKMISDATFDVQQSKVDFDLAEEMLENQISVAKQRAKANLGMGLALEGPFKDEFELEKDRLTKIHNAKQRSNLLKMFNVLNRNTKGDKELMQKILFDSGLLEKIQEMFPGFMDE